MGNHYNYKEEKCWSCAFFCGVRKENKGFLGNSVETSSSGTCSCNRSSKYNCKVYDNDRGCFKYQRWGALDASLAQQERDKLKKEQQRANEKLINDQRRQEEEFQRQKEELERQTRELERERERLEYERWYSSLSPEEQKAEDIRKEEERIRFEKEYEERQAQREEESKRKEEIRKKNIRKGLIIGSSLVGVIALIIGITNIVKTIKNSVEEKRKAEEFNKSPTGIFSSYILSKANTDDGVYLNSMEVEDKGTIHVGIEYKKNYFTDDSGRKYDFRAYTVLVPKAESHYTQLAGILCFNLEGTDNRNSFGKWKDKYGEEHDGNPNYLGKIEYGNQYMLMDFTFLGYDSVKQEPTHQSAAYSYSDNWDNSYKDYISEWYEESWAACLASYAFANGLYFEATGNNLYKE